MATKDYYKGITIQYRGDSSNLSAVLSKMNAELRQSQGAARALDAALKLDPKSLDLVRDRTKVVEKQIENARGRVEALSTALEKVKSPKFETDIAAKLADVRARIAEAGDMGEKELKKLQREADALQGRLDGRPELIERLTQQADAAEARLKSLTGQLVELNVKTAMGTTTLGKAATGALELGSTLKGVGEGMSSVGDKMTVGLTAPVVALAASTVNAAKTIDSALTDVKKTVDGTEEQYRQLKEAAVEYSKTNDVTAEQTLQVQALGAQLGYAIDELEMLGRVGTGMDIATDMNAEQATTEMAQFANITGMAHDKSENYASTVVALGNTMATTESKVSGMAQSIAAAGTQVGMSEAEILGLSAALSSMGLEAQGGGSNISKIMSQIDKDVATGAKDVRTWAAVAGASAEDFAEMWRSRPVEALQAVFSGMSSATAAGTNLSVILDALGIQSSQATDVAKRLASGHELLGKAIETANEAWRENTALTEEVANRNASLEAKMQMLQNRLTAIMERVGRPVADALLEMVDAAEPLFSAIECGAKAFADMDEGQQRLIVSTAALVAAFGPALSISGRVVSTYGDLLVAFGNAGKGALTFAEAMRAGLTVTESLEFASEGLGATLTTGLLGVGLAAGIALIGQVVASIGQWADHVNMVHKATVGLGEAVRDGGAALESYGESAERAATSTADVVSEADEALRSVADFADTIRGTLGDVGDSLASVERHAATIKELGNQGSITSGELAELQNAVAQYNEATGAAVEITDQTTGALNLLAPQIDEVTQAYRRQAEQKAYADLYNEAVKEQAKVERELKSVTDELEAMTAKYGVSLGDAGTLMLWNVNEARDLEARQNELSASSQALAGDIDHWKSMMDSTPASFSSVESAMTAAGVTGEQYRSLTTEQLAEVRAAFDGTVASIAGKLTELGISVRDVGSAAVDAAKGTADGVRNQAEGLSSDLQSIIDDTGDKAIKAQQKANAATLKEQQKANDRFLKQQQNQLEKSLKSIQDGFAAEEEALRKSNESRLSEMRKANDLEEKELKSRLDRQKELRSKELAAEVDAEKSANDKILKDAKAAEEKRTKEYKAETSKRLKEMEREYEQRRKLIEANDGTGDIDAKIKQLEGENEAEKRAATERERNEKVAELKTEVERAKSRRKRAEAEKALNDYLLEVEQERRAQERSDEIDRLNEQKASIREETEDKLEQLRERYEQEKEEYSNQRAEQAELDAEHYDNEYQNLKERLDQSLSARRESNEAILKDIEERNQAEIDAMAELHDQQESQRKEQLDAELSQMRESHQEQLAEIRESNQEKIQALREAQSEQIDAMREAQSEQIDAMRDGQSEQVALARSGGSELIAAADEANEAIVLGAEETTRKVTSDLAKRVEESKKRLEEARKVYSEGSVKLNQGFMDPFAVTRSKTNTIVSDIHNYALDRLKGLKTEVPDVAKSATGDFIQRLKEANEPTRGASGAMASAAKDPLDSLPVELGERGHSAAQNFERSLEAGGRNARTVASNLAVGVGNELTWLPNSSGTWGSDLVTNFANGIWAAYDLATGAARGIAETVHAFLGHTVAEKGPLHEGGMGERRWGEHLVDNLILGAQSRESALAAQMERLGRIAEASFAPDLGTRYDASLAYASSMRRDPQWWRSGDAATQVSISIDMNLSGMQLAANTDIRAASRALAQETARQVAAKLG